MATSKVAVLTTTFYPDKDVLRFRLATSLIRVAIINMDYDVIIVDESPDETIRQTFFHAGATYVAEQRVPGIGPSRRQLFSEADDPHYHGSELDRRREVADIFVWTEPEKVGLIHLIPEIIAPIKAGKADIVIPRRTSLDSYPAFQARTETVADRVYESYMGSGLRPMFGPVAWSRAVMNIFQYCDPRRYGGHDTYIQHLAPMEARAMGYRVAEVEVDFTYPSEQRAEEESALSVAMMLKRLDQQWQCVDNYIRVGNALGLRAA